MASSSASAVVRTALRQAGSAARPVAAAATSSLQKAASSSSRHASSSSSASQTDPSPLSSGVSSSAASLDNTLASARSSGKSASEQATGQSTAAGGSGLRATLLKGLANVMGYNSTSAAAVRATSDYYDRCSERDEREGTFWYDECGLPVSYQSWMSITSLHIWLLSVRFRSLPAPLGKQYIQELVNHYFIHSESLMRGRYGVKQGRLIKGYLRDQLYQYHGANMGYDEGLISESDAVLAAAVWRNIFGAGWGRVGGIKGKLNQDNKDQSDSSDKATSGLDSALMSANLDPSLPPNPSPAPDVPNQAGGYHAGGSGMVPQLPAHRIPELDGIQAKDARFAVNLERLVKWIRSEVNRMERLDDQVVMRALNMQGAASNTRGDGRGSLVDFQRI